MPQPLTSVGEKEVGVDAGAAWVEGYDQAPMWEMMVANGIRVAEDSSRKCDGFCVMVCV